LKNGLRGDLIGLDGVIKEMERMMQEALRNAEQQFPKNLMKE